MVEGRDTDWKGTPVDQVRDLRYACAVSLPLRLLTKPRDFIMASLSKRVGQAASSVYDSASGAASSAYDSASGAASSLVDTVSSFAGRGNAAEAEQVKASGSGGGWSLPTLSGLAGLFGGESQEESEAASATPGVEVEPTFGDIHSQTDHLVEEVEPAATPYKRTLDAYAAGDIDGAVASFHEMKPLGRTRLASARPELLSALAAVDSLAAEVEMAAWEEAIDRDLRSALTVADIPADGVAGNAWDRYAASRDDKWFASRAEGARVVLPPHTETIEIRGIPVQISIRAVGVVSFVMRDERHGEVEVHADLACDAALSASWDGRSSEGAVRFSKKGIVGRSVDGDFSHAEAGYDFSVG